MSQLVKILPDILGHFVLISLGFLGKLRNLLIKVWVWLNTEHSLSDVESLSYPEDTKSSSLSWSKREWLKLTSSLRKLALCGVEQQSAIRDFDLSGCTGLYSGMYANPDFSVSDWGLNALYLSDWITTFLLNGWNACYFKPITDGLNAHSSLPSIWKQSWEIIQGDYLSWISYYMPLTNFHLKRAKTRFIKWLAKMCSIWGKGEFFFSCFSYHVWAKMRWMSIHEEEQWSCRRSIHQEVMHEPITKEFCINPSFAWKTI